jgi:hypothetical protein
MTVTPNPNDLPAVLEQLQQAEPDLLRSMLTAFVQALMSADAQCGAEYGSRGPDRTNRRNGYRHREWDTRAGTIELAIPKLREGSYFPDWLLERRKRAERALIWLSRPAICLACRPGGWRSWSTSSASPACRSPMCR